MLNEKTIGFIGAGSMAEAMVSGIVASDIVPAENVIVSNRSNENRLNDSKINMVYSVLVRIICLLKIWILLF